jgi:hypothetical protein
VTTARPVTSATARARSLTLISLDIPLVVHYSPVGFRPMSPDASSIRLAPLRI